ncbi:MAG: S41 family peptidase [Planctomycetota bacterium]
MKQLLLLVTAMGLIGHSSLCGEDPAAAKNVTALNVQSFDKVWSLVKERHWDSEAVGESWDRARDELRPKVEAAADQDAARKVIGELIGRLNQSHFAVVPKEVYEEIEGDDDDGNNDKDGYTGLVIREREDKLIITQIHADSPAAASVLRPGWTIEEVGKRTVADFLKVARVTTKDGPMTRQTMIGLLGEKRSRGSIGDTLKLKCTDLEGKSHDVELTLTKAPGTRVKLGNFPEMQVAITSKVDDNGIGYFAFSSFFDPQRMMEAYDELLSKSSTGLVIDLRGNHGGLVILPPAIGSRLSGEGGKMGRMQMKGAKINLLMNPWADPYEKPVAILIDECSISAAEILAGGLKDLKLARVFGSRTAGLVLPSTFERLPNGDGIQYAFADYRSASGDTLEGIGVTPDEEVELTTDAYKKAADPVFARASEWIQSQSD